MSPTWHNHSGEQRCRPRAIVTPRSLEDLVELVRRAEREGTTVRAVGAGHSWSDIALTDGYLVDPEHLTGLLALDDGCLRAEALQAPLVRVQGGTHLRDLNPALEREGLALPNMGGYDAQTIAGVVSTSTHGSGIGFGPFPDLVRSLDLVVSGGAVVRVEPADGPTDAAAFATAHGDARRLIQDDATFAAAACGIGSLGIVHSLVLEVRERFWLNEVRTLDTWEAVRERLSEDDLRAAGEHYELFLNPYAGDDGRHRLLVTVRTPCPEPDGLAPDKLERHPLTELEASIPLTGVLLRLYMRLFPSTLPKRFDDVLAGMVDDGYASASYKVFNIGAANKLPAYSMELAIPLDGGRHVEAIDRILQIARRRRDEERMYHTSPVALRFVAPSRAYASMMHERATMMIELIMVPGTPKGHELLAGYEDALADLGVRPHWGQFNVLTAERARASYPRWDDWLAVRRELAGSGVFDSDFTRRLGM